MMENTIRLGERQKDARSGGGLFSRLERTLKLEDLFEEGFPVKYLPKILFVMLLGILYISNSHHAEKTVRKINRLNVEVEDLRADYTTLKADLMYVSKQSEVARRVHPQGLVESSVPPYKIIIHAGEY